MPSVILYGLFFFLHYGCWMKTNRGKMKINEKWMKTNRGKMKINGKCMKIKKPTSNTRDWQS